MIAHEVLPLTKTEKRELKKMRASGPRARFVHVRFGDPPPHRFQPEHEWAELRMQFVDDGSTKEGDMPRAKPINRALVVFHPHASRSERIVSGSPLNIKALLNDMLSCGERVCNKRSSLSTRRASACRFVQIGNQLVSIGGEDLARGAYQAVATVTTLGAIEEVLHEAAVSAAQVRDAPKEASPHKQRPPRPKRRPPKKPAAAAQPVPPTEEAQEARRQHLAKHEQREVERRAAEREADAAHKRAMAERRAARGAAKKAAKQSARAR